MITSEGKVKCIVGFLAVPSTTPVTSDAYLIKWGEQIQLQETWRALGTLQIKN